MSGELGQIRNYLGRLTRWERVLVALRAGLQALALLGLLLVWAVLAAWAGVSQGGAWVSLGVISGVGLARASSGSKGGSMGIPRQRRGARRAVVFTRSDASARASATSWSASLPSGSPHEAVGMPPPRAWPAQVPWA